MLILRKVTQMSLVFVRCDTACSGVDVLQDPLPSLFPMLLSARSFFFHSKSSSIANSITPGPVQGQVDQVLQQPNDALHD